MGIFLRIFYLNIKWRKSNENIFGEKKFGKLFTS